MGYSYDLAIYFHIKQDQEKFKECMVDFLKMQKITPTTHNFSNFSKYFLTPTPLFYIFSSNILDTNPKVLHALFCKQPEAPAPYLGRFMETSDKQVTHLDRTSYHPP